MDQIKNDDYLLHSVRSKDRINSDESIIIVGAIRNGEKYIDLIFKNIYFIVSQFKEYKIMIYENDSNDESRNILKNYNQKDENINLIFENQIDQKYPYRTQRLAYIRNTLLQKTIEKYNSYTYLLIMDMDDVNSTSKIVDTFHHIFEYNPKIWDIQTIHQTKEYYDIWAFRKRGYIEYDCWYEYFHDINQNKISQEEAYQKHIIKYQKPFQLRRGLIPVISAFGGAAIYKIELLNNAKNAKYIGLCQYGEICEHVPFHTTLVNQYKAKIFINPLWINKE
jgi:hypothetical protein